jgi:SAM-dependent methyltransferase
MATSVTAPRTIRSQPRHNCLLCGSTGDILHKELVDRRFNAPGKWKLRRCPQNNCGLIWLDPFPLEEDIGIAYEDYPTHNDDPAARDVSSQAGWLKRISEALDAGYLANRWGRDPGRFVLAKKSLGLLVLFDPSRRTHLDRSMVYLAKTQTGHVLEVGCGSGSALLALQNLGWATCGVDTDPQAVATAQRKGLKVSVGSLLSSHFPDAHFDAVLIQHVFEHLFDPIETLRECVRVLKRGGRLILVTPNSKSLGHYLFGPNWIHLHPPNHLYLYQRKLLKLLAERAGFAEVQSFTTAYWADCAFTGSWAIKRTGRSKEPVQSAGWSRLLAHLEAVLIPVMPSLGEECNLIAIKE